MARYRGRTTCTTCNGGRLRQEASYVKVNKKNIQELIDYLPEPGIRTRGAAGNVLTTGLGSLELKRKQSFIYLFDYGHEWRFKVRVHAINENADPDAEYPRTVESVGEPPRQYRSWD